MPESNPALATPGSVLILLYYRSREKPVRIVMKATKTVPNGVCIKASHLNSQDIISRIL